MPSKQSQASLPPLRVYGQTHVGRRRTNNEDNLAWTHVGDKRPLYEHTTEWLAKLRGGMQLGERIRISKERIEKAGRLYVIADGVGGNDDGELASEYTVRHVTQHFYTSYDAQRSPQEQLAEAIRYASEQVYTAASQRSSNAAATVVAALVWDAGSVRKVQFANVGDSPAFLFRASDSSYEQVEQSRQHVDPVNNTLEQSMGDFDLEPHFSAVQTLAKDDIAVLCSDGLTDLVKPAEIGRIVRNSTPQAATSELISLANERGGHDNITAIVIRNGSAPPPVRAIANTAGIFGGIALMLLALFFLTSKTAADGAAVAQSRPTLVPIATRAVIQNADGTLATVTLAPVDQQTATAYAATAVAYNASATAEALAAAQQPTQSDNNPQASDPGSGRPNNGSENGAGEPAATPRPQPTAKATVQPALATTPPNPPSTAEPTAEPTPTTNPDSDGDGVPNTDDACPDKPAQTQDGCPLPTSTPVPAVADADNDGVPDDQDFCPSVAQGEQGRGGCPDTDGDGIVDKDDKCPSATGDAQHGGCRDLDGDGFIDPNDDCPNDAGSINGCPDSDEDGIADWKDSCPSEKGPPPNGCKSGPTTPISPRPKGTKKTLQYNKAIPNKGVESSLLGFTQPTYSISESAGLLSTTVALSPTAATTVTLSYSSTAGTAASGLDFVPLSGTLELAPGTVSATIELSISADLLPEPTEWLSLTLISAQGADLDPQASTTRIEILDDDQPAEPVIAWSSPVYTVSEALSTTVLTFTVQPPLSATIGISSVLDTADALDFSAISQTLALTDTQDTYTVTVAITPDSTIELTETFWLDLSAASGALLDRTQVQIIDDDMPPPLNVEWITPSPLITESNTTISLTFSVSPAASTTITLRTVDDSALAGSDFVPLSATVTLTDATSLYTVSVALLDDDIAEPSERVWVDLYDEYGRRLARLPIILGNNDPYIVYLPWISKPEPLPPPTPTPTPTPTPPPVCAFAGSPNPADAPELLLDGRGCVGDFNNQTTDSSDYYTITLTIGQIVQVELDNQSSGDDYDLYVYDSNYQSIAKSDNSGNSDEHITLSNNTPTGTYLIQVYWYQSGGPGNHQYTLSGQRQ